MRQQGLGPPLPVRLSHFPREPRIRLRVTFLVPGWATYFSRNLFPCVGWCADAPIGQVLQSSNVLFNSGQTLPRFPASVSVRRPFRINSRLNSREDGHASNSHGLALFDVDIYRRVAVVRPSRDFRPWPAPHKQAPIIALKDRRHAGRKWNLKRPRRRTLTRAANPEGFSPGAWGARSYRERRIDSFMRSPFPISLAQTAACHGFTCVLSIGQTALLENANIAACHARFLASFWTPPRWGRRSFSCYTSYSHRQPRGLRSPGLSRSCSLTASSR